jgi:hypothetical protein
MINPKDARAFPPASSWKQVKTGKLEHPQWLLLDVSKTMDWSKPKYEIIPAILKVYKSTHSQHVLFPALNPNGTHTSSFARILARRDFPSSLSVVVRF